MFNRYNRLQGWSNSPLTEAGVKDAERAGAKLSQVRFSAAYCSDTTRAQITAESILAHNTASHPVPHVFADMHFREQCYGYFEGQDMSSSWWAAGAPHGAGTYNAIVQQYGLGASRDFLHEADPFHDAESDEEYWRRIEGGFDIIAGNKELQDSDHVLVISHGNTLLSLMHRFGGEAYDLSERPRNGSVTTVEFDTSKSIEQALTVRTYNQ
jgi:probable phosphoglycerate mutase